MPPRLVRIRGRDRSRGKGRGRGRGRIGVGVGVGVDELEMCRGPLRTILNSNYTYYTNDCNHILAVLGGLRTSSGPSPNPNPNPTPNHP